MIGGSVVAARAGEIINEIAVAVKAQLSIVTLARTIHPYPTTAEAVMQCGLGYVRKHWERLPDRRSRDGSPLQSGTPEQVDSPVQRPAPQDPGGDGGNTLGSYAAV